MAFKDDAAYVALGMRLQRVEDDIERLQQGKQSDKVAEAIVALQAEATELHHAIGRMAVG